MIICECLGFPANKIANVLLPRGDSALADRKGDRGLVKDYQNYRTGAPYLKDIMVQLPCSSDTYYYDKFGTLSGKSDLMMANTDVIGLPVCATESIGSAGTGLGLVGIGVIAILIGCIMLIINLAILYGLTHTDGFWKIVFTIILMISAVISLGHAIS